MSNSAKYFYFIGSLFFTGYIIVIAKPILAPLLAALLLAILLRPLVHSLEKIKVPRIISIALPVTFSLIILITLILFFSSQLIQIDIHLSSLEHSFKQLAMQIQNLPFSFFHIDVKQQTEIIHEALKAFLKHGTAVINNTLQVTTHFIGWFLFFIISLVFLLYYREEFIHVLFKLIPKKQHEKIENILKKIQPAISNYLLSFFAIIFIVGLLNTVGLLLLGVKHAVLFGMLAAVLTVIPYFGILIGALLPTFFVLLTKDSLLYPLGVILIFTVVQFLEGNFLTPFIAGKNVNLNPFAIIVGLIISGMLLGLMGVIIALPLLAIVKIIFYEFKSTRPLAALIDN